ncbi:hypothetical protein INT47_003438 [Mucor saturninus]|uniref:J domain-containing protein n=1 Tax=Mucor saturninus TaxID=64648 RepID=A0A8H7RFE7_9FUNG|nr:hypothetical protein INT47_003438 [Mucor saturninus]
MAEDYYTLLGVSRNADEKEIKKAYRQQALRFHPDRNKEGGAKQQFQKINEAFETLSDRQKRYAYDDIHSTTTSHADLFSQFFHSPPASSEEEDDNPFFNMFKSSKPKSVKRSLDVSLDDLYTGTTKRLKVTRTLYNGHKDDTILNLNILPGWKDGTKVVFPHQGDVLSNGEQQDIEFEIKEKPHPIYRRDRYDLSTVVQISLLEALTGFKKELKRLDGSTLLIEESTIIQPGQERVLIDEGMPKYKSQKKGNLIIKYHVQFPKSLTPEQTDILKLGLAPSTTT